MTYDYDDNIWKSSVDRLIVSTTAILAWENNSELLWCVLSLNTIGQEGRILFCGTLKFKVGFVTKVFRDSFTASKSLKLSSTLNCVLKRPNDSKTISIQKLEAVPCEQKSLPNPSGTQQRYNKYILVISSSWSVL